MSVRNVVQIPRDAGTATSWLICDELLRGRRWAGLVSFLKPAHGHSGTVQESTFVSPGVNCAIPRQDPRISSGRRIPWSIVLEKRWTKDKGQCEKVAVSNRTPGSWLRGHFERFRDASSLKVSLIRAVGF